MLQSQSKIKTLLDANMTLSVNSLHTLSANNWATTPDIVGRHCLLDNVSQLDEV